MRKLLFVSLLAFLPLSAFAQYGNVIHEVEPVHGPVIGGTRVVITGDFRMEPITSPPCFGADVYIGGQKAEVVSFTTERVEVETLPYTSGRFDVVVSRCGIDAVRENGFTYGDVLWERVLLPVILPIDVSGAFGSLWRTEVAGMNLSGSARVSSNPNLICVLPIGCGPFAGPFLPPRPSFAQPTDGPGQILYIEGSEPRDIHLTLRVRDVSREHESLGTELPVVWEDDAYGPNTFFAIPDIPRGPLYRHKLRLYRVDIAEPAELEVRIVDENNQVTSTHFVTLSAGREDAGYVLAPPYAELDLEPLAATPGTRRALVIRTPPEGLYWGFLSVTNNATQQITTVRP